MAASSLQVEIVGNSPLWRSRDAGIADALAAAAVEMQTAGTISVLLGDDASIAQLNKQFRGKEGPTNVLSFPPVGPPEARDGFLGDIALAAETIAAEAEFQGKSFDHHAIHVAVHGFLHLLGYDHENPADAEVMEARERVILASLGIEDPYA